MRGGFDLIVVQPSRTAHRTRYERTNHLTYAKRYHALILELKKEYTLLRFPHIPYRFQKQHTCLQGLIGGVPESRLGKDCQTLYYLLSITSITLVLYQLPRILSIGFC